MVKVTWKWKHQRDSHCVELEEPALVGDFLKQISENVRSVQPQKTERKRNAIRHRQEDRLQCYSNDELLPLDHRISNGQLLTIIRCPPYNAPIRISLHKTLESPRMDLKHRFADPVPVSVPTHRRILTLSDRIEEKRREEKYHFLMCLLCKARLVDPVILNCCQKTGCKQCVVGRISGGHCPFCEGDTDVSLLKPNEAIQKRLVVLSFNKVYL